MIAKLALIIIIAALLSLSPGFAELVRLHNYTIDTGSYIVPSNHIVEEPVTLNGVYYESLSWNIGKNKIFNILVARADRPVDPRSLAGFFMARDWCNDSNLKNINASQTEKPYPGWITACYAKGKGATLKVYTGSIDNETTLMVTTTEAPEIMARLLGNLRVITPEGLSEALAANQIKTY